MDHHPSDDHTTSRSSIMATSGVFAGEEEISMLLTDQRNLAAEIEPLVTDISKTSVSARIISARQE